MKAENKRVTITLTISQELRAWLEEKRRKGFVISRVVENAIAQAMSLEIRKKVPA